MRTGTTGHLQNWRPTAYGALTGYTRSSKGTVEPPEPHATIYFAFDLVACLGGSKIVPERIRENRRPYYDALKAADKAWELGHLDFSVMEEYLAALVQEQIEDQDMPASGA